MERKKFVSDCIVHLVLIAVILVLDQVTKVWARNVLAEKSITVWKDVFSFHLVFNTGASFGVFKNHTLALTIFSIVAMIAIVVVYFWLPKVNKMRIMRLTMAIILAGGIGNIIDRIAFKKVTDMFYFELINFPVFNVADIGVTCGEILLFALWIFYYKEEDFKEWKKSDS